MTAAFLALLPVFAVILAGFGLRRSGLIDQGHWDAVDHICYYVLFPAIIFKEIAGADFTGVPVWGMALAMMLAISTMFALLLAFRRQICAGLGLGGPQFASLFQGATRWHTFIALAIIPIYFGQGSLALGGLSAAAMIPLLNIVNVAVHALYAQHSQLDPRAILWSILRNPFVLASAGGVLWRALGLPLPALGAQILTMIGSGALGLALLTVGAGLRLDDALTSRLPVLAAVGLKLLVMPLFMMGWTHVLGVTGQAQAVAVLCGAVPTGSGAYVLARKMGGDAGMVANILTLQVVAAALTIPLVLSIVR
jgi:predicted permease